MYLSNETMPAIVIIRSFPIPNLVLDFKNFNAPNQFRPTLSIQGRYLSFGRSSDPGVSKF